MPITNEAYVIVFKVDGNGVTIKGSLVGVYRLTKSIFISGNHLILNKNFEILYVDKSNRSMLSKQPRLSPFYGYGIKLLDNPYNESLSPELEKEFEGMYYPVDECKLVLTKGLVSIYHHKTETLNTYIVDCMEKVSSYPLRCIEEYKTLNQELQKLGISVSDIPFN